MIMMSNAVESRKKKFFEDIKKINQNIENTLKMCQDIQIRNIPEFITITDEFGEELIVFYN